MEIDLVTFWRVLNILLGIITLIILTLDSHTHRYELSKRRLYLTMALGLFILSAVVGSVESIYHQEPLRFRTGLYTSSYILTLIGLWISRDDPS